MEEDLPRRLSTRKTVPGLREIDLATVRAQYVREHKNAPVSGDHMAEVCSVSILHGEVDSLNRL